MASLFGSWAAFGAVAAPVKSWAADASLTLFAEGGSFQLPLITALQNSSDGVAAVAPVVPGFFNANVDQARDDFASGQADYAVSELPLTSDQATKAAQNNRPFAYVPFAASPLAIGAIVACSNDQVLKPTTLCPNLQLSVALVAKAMTNGVSSWNDPQFSQASGGSPIFSDDESANIRPVNQVDPSAVNLMLESLFVNDPTNGNAAKKVWDAFITQLSVAADTPTERWPTNGGVSGGDRAVADSLIPVNETTLVPDTNPSTWGNGDIAALPADWLGPPRNIPTVAIQNVAGQYVAPTVAGMTAALKDATIDASTNLVTFHANPANAAAYPIPTMSYLIVPTAGLTATKATALASFIRYVLGSKGQAVVQSLGEAPLPSEMVSVGLHVADLVAAEATTTTTTTTSTTVPSAKTTSTTAVHLTSTAAGGSGGGTSATSGSATGPTLAATGAPPWSIPILGAGMLLVGILVRRLLRRRLLDRGAAS